MYCRREEKIFFSGRQKIDDKNDKLPVLVDDGIKGQAVPPGGGEVADIDIMVASGLQLAPDTNSLSSATN
jgi:hypothetical protein